jgi:hypothetical protein
MNCHSIRETFAEYLLGDLNPSALADVQAHLSSCPACREELESLSAVWAKLGVLPREQPGPDVRQRFYDMLEAYKEGMEKATRRVNFGQMLSLWVGRVMPRRPVYQLALSLVLLSAGLTTGYLLNGRRPALENEMASLRAEVKDMRQAVALSMLKQASPSERLLGVSWSAQLKQPDERILLALLETLDDDPNINVRLAAVDALYLFYDYPRVKSGLSASLARQTSPLVQLALIDLLVEIRERRAAEALRTLIRDEKLNPEVKKRAEIGLARLSS